MAVRIVPRRRIEADPTKFNLQLIASTKQISEKLAFTLEGRLKTHDKKLEDEIKKLRETTAQIKNTHAEKTRALYTQLLTAIVAVQNDDMNKKFSYSIGGQYNDAKTARSLNYWAECNPAYADAVECVMFELKQGGWSPQLLLPEGSDIINPEPTEYPEPCRVFLVCDFTEQI